MRESKEPRTLDCLIRHYCSQARLASDIDKAMLGMVLLLRHEPEFLKDTISCYESLYQLRNLILKQES